MEGDAPLERFRWVTSLLAERDPARLVPIVLDQAVELVRAERGFVILVASDGRLDVAAARNLAREDIAQPEFQVSRTVVERVARGGAAERIANAADEPSTRDQTSVRALSLRSILCVPLRAHGRTLGAVYVDHRFEKGRFGADDLATLAAFAVPAAIALDTAQRQAELVHRLATIDRLRAELSERYRQQALETERLRGEVLRRSGPPASDEGLPGLVARSAAMKRVVALARRAAPSDATILVVGESGVGKDRLVRAIHELSPRARGPFVAESCAGFTETLLESELFGHERGAFTGATEAREGLFERARGGTVFLDEVGEMGVALQARLLRVLEEREVRRVGGSSPVRVDVRIVAATHRDLEAMVARGEFRADLFYRLNVVRIEIPPLRERIEDVPALLDHFLAKEDANVVLEPQTRELLLTHGWPGNVRELANEVSRLAVLAGSGGRIGPGLLSATILGRHAKPVAVEPDGEAPIEGVWRLDDLEKEMIERALRRAQGKKILAARLLGIPKTSLYNRLEKHGLHKPEAGA
jgi:transcriptional regulator with GAF, ATPase, and Fis domain